MNENHIRNISVALKKFYLTHEASNKGIPMKEETKLKQSMLKKNIYPNSLKEYRDKFGVWNKGKKGAYKVSNETKDKLSLITKNRILNGELNPFKKGRTSYMKGKHHSLSSRIKVSLSKSKDRDFLTFKSKLIKRLRINNEYLEWRSNIFKRDNYHCQNCGKHNCYLEVHHIIPLSKMLSDFGIANMEDAIACKPLWDEGNGITYCRGCHLLLDKNICRKKQELELT